MLFDFEVVNQLQFEHVGYFAAKLRCLPLDKELSLDVVHGTSSAWPAEIQLSEIPDELGYSLGYTSLRGPASATVSGDVDGDGVDEFLVNSTDTASDQWPEAGRTNMLFGGQLAASVGDFERLLDETNSVAVVGVNDDLPIWRAVSAGDLNGDGLADQAIAAPSATVNGEERAGRVFLLYGQDYRQSISHRGDLADNNLVGDGSANQLVGGPGDDTLAGAGGADVVYGGAGDDLIVITDAAFQRIDGGTGRDTLRVDGTGVTLDLTAMGDHRFQNVEVIDLNGVGPNSLILDPREVLRSSASSNTLIVHRGNDDSVERGSTWTYEGLHRLAGDVYQRFTQGAALLMVEPAAAWRNPVDSLDVSNDGVVAPGDLLRIINEINSQAVSDATGRLPSVDSLTDLAISYYDANGDDHVTPADALRIVNHFSPHEPSPEGEQPPEGSSLLATTTLFVELSRAVAVQLTDDARIGSPARNRDRAANLNEPLLRKGQTQLLPSHGQWPIVDAIRGRHCVFVDQPNDLETFDRALEELLDEMACELIPLTQ